MPKAKPAPAKGRKATSAPKAKGKAITENQRTAKALAERKAADAKVAKAKAADAAAKTKPSAPKSVKKAKSPPASTEATGFRGSRNYVPPTGSDGQPVGSGPTPNPTVPLSGDRLLTKADFIGKCIPGLPGLRIEPDSAHDPAMLRLRDALAPQIEGRLLAELLHVLVLVMIEMGNASRRSRRAHAQTEKQQRAAAVLAGLPKVGEDCWGWYQGEWYPCKVRAIDPRGFKHCVLWTEEGSEGFTNRLAPLKEEEAEPTGPAVINAGRRGRGTTSIAAMADVATAEKLLA